jgi:4-phospho-D-threonate 3-dehydrogenase / 4-phospho-D-erythronate 3-dehydrogenase
MTARDANSSTKPVVAISTGDPAGIGGEIALKALTDPSIASLAHWVVWTDTAVLSACERVTGLRARELPAEFRTAHAIPAEAAITFGRLLPEYGGAAVEYVRRATEMCLSGKASAMVTAPLNKEAVSMTGKAFQGHTEFIAELCGAKESRMLLANERLAIVHVSTHTSLRNACNLQVDRIVRTIELGANAVKLLGRSQPRIAVCGLNPHAGEHGLFGSEDAEIIRPAIEICRRNGMDVDGPESPDTIFARAARGSHDLVVAMYHDQGHIAMKLIDFEKTVNISLGIPIIRTSVDHGTAFDIAGKNQADATNMKAAMRMAAQMAANRETGSMTPREK